MSYANEEALKALNESEESKKRSNAKAVDVFDLEGNYIATYQSGSLASQALGIQQGDISLCCRGVKASIGGYKFKFSNENDESTENIKLRRGYALEVVPETNPTISEKIETTKFQTSRSTRTSRGEYGLNYIDKDQAPGYSPAILAFSSIKTRKWKKIYVKLGNMVVQKWVPESDKVTSELQQMKAIKLDKKKGNRRHLNRSSKGLSSKVNDIGGDGENED